MKERKEKKRGFYNAVETSLIKRMETVGFDREFKTFQFITFIRQSRQQHLFLKGDNYVLTVGNSVKAQKSKRVAWQPSICSTSKRTNYKPFTRYSLIKETGLHAQRKSVRTCAQCAIRTTSGSSSKYGALSSLPLRLQT